jgi:hypothetical protein
LQEELLKEWDEVPTIFTTSTKRGDGRQQVLHYIAQLRMLFTGEAMPSTKMLTVEPSEAVDEEVDEDSAAEEPVPQPSV